MSDQEIYQKFIEWVDNPLAEVTESEWLMPMITTYITPEEAEFLTGIPLTSKSLEELAGMKGMDPAQLAPKLKALCEKGLVYESIRGDSRRYRLLDFNQIFYRMPYWPGIWVAHSSASCPERQDGKTWRRSTRSLIVS